MDGLSESLASKDALKERFSDEEQLEEEKAEVGEAPPDLEGLEPFRRLKDPPPTNAQPEDVSPPIENAAESEPGSLKPPPEQPEEEPKGESTPESEEAPRREINPSFKDVHQTGSWGEISNLEKIAVGVVALLILVGVIIVVVIMVVGKEEEVEVAPATMAPTRTVTVEERLTLLLQQLQTNPVTAELAETLSKDPAFYVGRADDPWACAKTPSECAVSWALYQDRFPQVDDNNNSTKSVERMALAALYFSLIGPGWKNSTNWLTNSSYCQWEGIHCNRLETKVEEIALNENNLQGAIPLELSLMETVVLISMKRNAISGPLPGEVFGALPHLFALYLQRNLLTGPIPDNLRNEQGSLVVLFLNGNSFEGPFPAVYCPAGPVFKEFSLDCKEKNECVPECCDPSENCF